MPYFRAASEKTGVPIEVLMGICAKESTMGVGSSNVMRISSTIASKYGCKNKDIPKDCILASAKYMADLIKLSNGNIAHALVGYNCGEFSKTYKNFENIYPNGYVDKVLSLAIELKKHMLFD